MVSSRQRRVKAHRKNRAAGRRYITENFHLIAEAIRKVSFRSLPIDMQKEIGASPSRDNGIRNSEGDMPGQVGTGTIGADSCKDVYRFAWPEDLEYARKILNKVIK